MKYIIIYRTENETNLPMAPKTQYAFEASNDYHSVDGRLHQRVYAQLHEVPEGVELVNYSAEQAADVFPRVFATKLQCSIYLDSAESVKHNHALNGEARKRGDVLLHWDNGYLVATRNDRELGRWTGNAIEDVDQTTDTVVATLLCAALNDEPVPLLAGGVA